MAHPTDIEFMKKMIPILQERRFYLLVKEIDKAVAEIALLRKVVKTRTKKQTPLSDLFDDIERDLLMNGKV